MSRILVYGGHGTSALRLAPLLVAAGHQVSAVIRNPAHAEEVEATGADPVIADVEHLDLDALTAITAGHDLVIWSAGAGGGDPARTRAVDRDAAIRSMTAAEAAGVERYLMVSYLGARTDHGVDPSSSFFAYAEAKAEADAHLRTTGLAWTILGPGTLTLEPGTGRIEVSSHPAEHSVPRDDVAAVIAAAVERPALAGRTIGFNRGTTPVATALDEHP